MTPPTSGQGGVAWPSNESAQEQPGAWAPSFDDDEESSPLADRLSGRDPGGPPAGPSGQQSGPADRTSFTPQPPPQAPARQTPQGPPPPPARPPQPPQGEQPTQNIPQTGPESPEGRGGAGGAGAADLGAGAGSLAAAGVSGVAAASAGGDDATTREPALITHKSSHGGYNYYADDEDDGYDQYSDDAYDDYDDGHSDFDDGGPDDPDDDMSEAARKRRMWRNIRRACYVAAAFMILAPVTAFAIGYNIWDVKSPEDVAKETSQTIVVKYADNSELTRIIPDNGENRTMIRDLNQDVSADMRNATLAAEDATFYRNQGFDAMGILYAVFKQATGRAGGGSTLTQQYIKLTTKADQATYTRKFKEIVLAFKMTNNYQKDDILKAYLNTAYYGRGAYGIHAAADAYFGKKPTELNAEESSVLAGMVQKPTQNDPKIDEVNAKRRWNYVMDQMAKNGWITPDRRQSAQMPVTQDRFAWRGPQITGSQAHIKQRVLAELNQGGYTEDTLAKQGYTIHTTIDPRAQAAAEDAVNKITNGQPDNLKTSLVAIDPRNGDVKAYYGGGNKVGGFDWANAQQEPGSSFKPFTALAALRKNSGIGETYDGSSPQMIAGHLFNNSEHVECDDPKFCSVREAMTKSVNTVFVNMAARFGPVQVQDAAYSAGIPKAIDGKPTLKNADGGVDAGIALGRYPVRTIDMASAYGTFANQGQRVPPRFVTGLEHNGELEHPFENKAQPALDPSPQESAKLAGNVTASMLDVVKNPKKPLNLFDNRPIAAKTGTHQFQDTKQNAKAWMVGYTPQISVAVSVGADNDGKPAPIEDKSHAPIYGSGLPGSVWQAFLNAYLKGQPVMQFPPFEHIEPFENKLPPPPPPPPEPTTTAPPSTTQQPTQSTQPSEPPTSSTSKEPGGGGGNCGGLFQPATCDRNPGGGW